VLSVDLFSGFGDRARRRKAVELLTAAREFKSAALRRARFEVAEARFRLEEAEEIKRVSEKSLEAAREGLRIVRRRYEAGLDPLTALLQAQAALDGARAGLVRAVGARDLARGALQHSAGTLVDILLSEFQGGTTPEEIRQ